MIRKTQNVLTLLVLTILLCSWGGTGHYIISYNAPNYFPASMSGFNVWADSLADHASDADNRKSSDNTEGPKHYIDIDMYSEFNSTGKIASTYDSIVNIYGLYFVTNNGTLPWATKNTYDSLKLAFQNKNWHKAVLFASDLGHYVADGHMPLHLTQYYDGETYSQKGIHSRYESSMVSKYQSYLKNYSGYSPPAVTTVSNVNLYVLKYIYNNYKYVDSVFIADDYAQTLDSYFSTTYYSTLWDKTQFTKTLFRNASHTLAELIYSAWVEAGSPPYGSTPVKQVKTIQLTIYPNPTNGVVSIQTDNKIAKAEIYSLDGKLQAVFAENHFDVGFLSDGVYVLSIYGKDGWVAKEKLMVKK
ncbi:hypothetical protein TRIP_D260087 [uncultured Paludibacter sp.]|nr:hypothetical protein TRIP_D260087 [uncultured Paludibacter sp.]